ncbi:hypothetical protein GC163_02425 [bacterium]|nr:hypothetical protein [bacterium]
MSANIVKLLHASDVQLDCPLRQVGTVPRDTIDLLASATLIAWERLIDAAIAHGVDALLLTGNTFDAAAESLAADVALRQGFERLLEREIPVFVVPGQLDPLMAWQEFPAMPENVTVFDSPWDAAVDLTDSGRLLARIFPVSAVTDISPPEWHRLQGTVQGLRDANAVTVGILWCDRTEGISRPIDTDERRLASVQVLACGQNVPESALPLIDGLVHAQTAPQAVTADETGPRGATILQFDSQRQLSKRFVPLGPVRREHLTARLEQARHRDELCEQMLAMIEELPAVPGEQLRLVRWSFAGSPAVRHQLDFQEATAHELLETLAGLTDQPTGLRYVHELVPLWQEQSVPPELGELWRDYLEYYDERPPLNEDELRQLALELRPQQAASSGPWERGLAQLDPTAVHQRARRYARKWFAGH